MTRPLASSSVSSAAPAARPPGRARFRASPSNRRMGIRAEAAQELIAETTSQHQQPSPPLVLVSLIAIQSIWSPSADLHHPPAADQLLGFLHQIIRRSRTNPNTLKLALFYIHQARRPLRQHISATTTNHSATNDPVLSGRKMFLAALMVASKYLLDRNYSNRAWAKIAGLPVEEINTNERVFLVLIDYRSHLDLDEFEVWSVRLQKLMREKRIGADRSEPDHHQPSSTVSSSSHSSPQRTSSSRPLSAHHSPPKPSSNTPSLKLGSPSKPLLRRPTLDLHTPIRQQAPRSDTRNGPATAPPRITQQRTGEDPSRTRQGSSDLTTPIRQQHALPPALAQAIPATAPAHLKPSGPSVCEPASTPLRRSTAPARQSSTPARQSSTPARQTSTPG
ncbi:hypothetical protein PtB15_3B122 [Puccinia triticina]|nr:hypothetical protein PtB15_3B122 [Puccinia triticina]